MTIKTGKLPPRTFVDVEIPGLGAVACEADRVLKLLPSDRALVRLMMTMGGCKFEVEVDQASIKLL